MFPLQHSASACCGDRQQVLAMQRLVHVSFQLLSSERRNLGSMGIWVLWVRRVWITWLAFELWFFFLYQESLIKMFWLQCVSPQAPLDHRSEMSLSDSGFEPGGKRNFLHLTDKDGEQPQLASAGLVRSPPWVSQTKKKKSSLSLFVCLGWIGSCW